MASYTKNLNLLKKDPVADGADTFNITTMLNDNWDKIDAEKARVDTALSNKTDGTTHKLQTYTAYTDIGLSGTDITPAQILDALPLNSMLVVNNTETTSLSDEYIPSVSYYGVLIAMKISSNALQLKWFTPLNGNGTRADDYTGVYRSASTPPWSGWAPEATAEPPQEYNLTTTNGRITYSKDQFERVYLYIYLTGITIEENKIIGTLPVGYRPSYLVSTLARIGGSFGTIDISTAGAITLRNTYDSTESGGIFASASFLAA